MKHAMTAAVLVAATIGLTVPASAQLGGLSGALKKVQQAQDAKQKLDDLTFSDDEERQIGSDVSTQIRTRFGVVQDPAIHKYVTLVGTLLAQQSERPKLAWTFIVLDTDGVNAFAAPGGFVHITRGALGLVDSEAELAAVLGHEIGHVVRKHTIDALQKGKVTKLAAEAAASRAAVLGAVANAAYSNIIENAFDRGDEMDADRLSVQLAQKSGYAAGTLGGFLTRLSDRNKDAQERNGLFASHPETKERIAAIGRLASSSKTTALAKARYDANVKYEPTPITSIAVVAEGSAGLTGSGGKEPAKKEEPKPRTGLGLTALKPTTTQEKQSAQVSASGGARGLGADRAAKGGGNPRVVSVTVSASEVAEFRKGIA